MSRHFGPITTWISYVHLGKNTNCLLLYEIPQANKSFCTKYQHLNIGRNRKPIKKEITTNTSRLELGTHFLDSIKKSIKICRFKTYLEQCFEKEPSCPFLLTITC